ncbi:OmpA family protein [Prevotella sp. ne3005]|uniref:OmpA family protein n=1 Tax=Prevotella sp. ne3005 TaxID=1761887 RepID=UPI001FCD0BF4|nr:OmpA family protein [Prevotella sp. ne3005]
MKKAILSCLMLMAGLSVSAQEQKGTTEYVFEPHWYVQIQGGAQYTTGETDFGKLISPNVQAAVGYNFSKAIGARLAINAWQGKGGFDKDKFDLTTIGIDKQDYKFTYFAPSIDLTFNLSNIIAGFNPNRKFEFGAFIGGGVNFRSKCDDAANIDAKWKVKYADVTSASKWTPMYENKSAVLPFAQAGLTADYKVSDKVSIGAEFNANILGDKFNFKNAGNPDSYFNLLLGAKIALGKTYSTKFIPAPEPEIKYVEKIVEKIVEVPAEPAVTAAEPLRRDIFFQINKTVIRDSEAQKVQDIVAYMNQNPTSKVMITGYADAGTGNDRINDRLAAGRADAVVKALKNAGIAESRISFDSKGARVQPFEDNDSNRVSICIAE